MYKVSLLEDLLPMQLKNSPVYLFFFLLIWTLFTLIKKFSLLQSMNLFSLSSPLLLVKSNRNMKSVYGSITEGDSGSHSNQGLRAQNSGQKSINNNAANINQAFVSAEAKFVSRQIVHQENTLPKSHINVVLTDATETHHSLKRLESTITDIHSQLNKKPLHKIEYGGMMSNGKRSPLVMIRSNLSSPVHKLLLNQDLFQSNEEDLPTVHKLYKAVDYVRAKDTHFYYEGYFHSLMTPDSILSRNPRSGQEFQKPAAKPVIRAFYESLRRLNNVTFSLLQQRLYSSAVSRSPNDPSLDVCGMLSDWILQGRLFSDISVQLHYGSHIHGNQLFWHSDAENSLLHFGLTLSGYRILHSKRAKAETAADITEVLEDQLPGTVYLSSSTLMNHAPEYPANTWEERIIAMQARIMYTTAQLKQFRAVRTDESWAALTRTLSETLSQATLNLPTVDDIQTVLSEMDV